MNQECLSHYNGTETQLAIKMFKFACLNYKPSDLVYRDNLLSRGQMINLRRELIDKVTKSLIDCKLFSTNLAYPRRYFDDLVLEQRHAEVVTQTKYNQTQRGLGSERKLHEMI